MDPTLYAGSARFYAAGRVAYPAELVDVLVDSLALDGSGRLLDVGCGPGSLTLLLASHFAEAIGVDADADMLAEAARLAEKQNVRNVSWQQLRAEELRRPAPVRVATFAQSLHWVDRRRVTAAVRAMLEPGGAAIHVHATTHQGLDTAARLAHPRPPREQITRLVRHYLGPQPRAGRGVLVAGSSEPEEVVTGPPVHRPGALRGARPGGRSHRRGVSSSVYSLSSAAPHLFGDRLEQFDAEPAPNSLSRPPRMGASSRADALDHPGHLALKRGRSRPPAFVPHTRARVCTLSSRFARQAEGAAFASGVRTCSVAFSMASSAPPLRPAADPEQELDVGQFPPVTWALVRGTGSELGGCGGQTWLYARGAATGLGCGRCGGDRAGARAGDQPRTVARSR